MDFLEDAEKKFIIPSLNAIEKFNTGGAFKTTLSYIPVGSINKRKEKKCTIKLSKTKNSPGFTFTITLEKLLKAQGFEYQESYGLDDKLYLSRGENTFSIGKNSVQDFITKFKQPQILKGVYTNFNTNDSENYPKSFWRLIIPISAVSTIDIAYPTDILEYWNNHMIFDNPEWNVQDFLFGRMPTRKGTFAKFSIRGLSFQFFLMDDLKMLFIDSCHSMVLSEFKSITNVIRDAFAFLSGMNYREETYYLSSNNSDFTEIENISYQVEEGSQISNQGLIRPPDFFDHYERQDNSYKKQNRKFHTMFPNSIFEKLCEEMILNKTFHRTIEIVLNTLTTTSPIIKGALYSVALETLTSIIQDDKPNSLNSIKDKKVAKAFRDDMKSVLNKYQSILESDAIEILTKKVDAINQPTNRKKLRAPFDLYKLELDKDEEMAIENRNKFLHGDSPLQIDEKFELDIIARRLHLLLGSLILKFIGYKGHIVNLPIWHYVSHKEKFKELMSKVSFEELMPLEEILELSEKGDKKRAFTELTKVHEAAKAMQKLNSLFKII